MELGDAIEPDVNLKVRALAEVLQNMAVRGLLEIVPTYRSVLLVYDPMLTEPRFLMDMVRLAEQRLPGTKLPPHRIVEIPVCYGGEFGPDMEFVAAYHGLSVEAVIQIHSSQDYQIYMMGFTPGFPFLGGLPEVLATPRLETPRLLVPAGSVAIAANQTGIYPIASPGGWRIIGRTPLRLFRPELSEPFLYRAGDIIRFKPISAQEFHLLAAQENGN